MPRTHTAQIGTHTLTLLLPLSERQITRVCASWFGALDMPAPANIAESRARNEAVELGAAEAIVRMASPDSGIPCVQRWARGEYATADQPGPAAADDLLSWCEEAGIPAADLLTALGAAIDAARQPTAALVEEARGNSAPTA